MFINIQASTRQIFASMVSLLANVLRLISSSPWCPGKKPQLTSSYTAIVVQSLFEDWMVGGQEQRHRSVKGITQLVLTVLLMTISVCPLSVFEQQNSAVGAYREHECPDQLSGLCTVSFPIIPMSAQISEKSLAAVALCSICILN